MSNAVAIPDLTAVKTFQEALEVLAGSGIEAHVVNDFDLVDKETLIDVPFLILDYRFSASSYGSDEKFVSVSAITTDDRKVVFVDGGSGIRDQLANFRAQGKDVVACKHGLRKSSFFFNEKTGETSNVAKTDFSPASTYYLA